MYSIENIIILIFYLIYSYFIFACLIWSMKIVIMRAILFRERPILIIYARHDYRLTYYLAIFVFFLTLLLGHRHFFRLEFLHWVIFLWLTSFTYAYCLGLRAYNLSIIFTEKGIIFNWRQRLKYQNINRWYLETDLKDVTRLWLDLDKRINLNLNLPFFPGFKRISISSKNYKLIENLNELREILGKKTNL